MYPYGLLGELALFAAIVEKVGPTPEVIGAMKIVEMMSVSVTKTIWVTKVVDVITVPGELHPDVDTATGEDLVVVIEGLDDRLVGA